MNAEHLERAFGKMGARVRVNRIDDPLVRVDVKKGKEGTYFDLRVGKEVEVDVLDVQLSNKHLLLLTHNNEGKSRFLLGRDERDWFVAAIPESYPASSVSQAMEALKPTAVVAAQEKKGVKPKKRNRRKNEAYIRQGEWFMMPTPGLKVDKKLVLKKEPLRRGRGKPHMAEELYRIGGTTVYVNSSHPNGITAKAYAALPSEARKGPWRMMSRDPEVYVRGKITHSDHKTIDLGEIWHRVYPNRETEARAGRNVAFLD
jgi:hypothetical protein